MRPQSLSCTPSLYVPCAKRIRSLSSMPRNALMCRICGIVASPTPTVPISADSIRRISRCGPSARASSAAAIQPAVPPPTITTRRIADSFIPEAYALNTRDQLPIRDDASGTTTARLRYRKSAKPRRRHPSAELVRNADFETATVLFPDQGLARIVVLIRGEDLVRQVRALRDQGQPVEASALERIAHLRVVGAATLQILLDARGADTRHLAQEAGAIAVADSSLEAVMLVVHGGVGDPLRQTRHGDRIRIASVHQRALGAIGSEDDAEAVKDRGDHIERQVQ